MNPRSSQIGLLMFCATLTFGCVEAAPELASNNVSSGGDAGTDASEFDAGFPLPDLEFDPFQPTRGSLQLIGQWYFFLDDEQTDVESVSGTEAGSFTVPILEQDDVGSVFTTMAPGTLNNPETVTEPLASAGEFSLELWVESASPRFEPEFLTFSAAGARLLSVGASQRRPVVRTATQTFAGREALGAQQLSHIVVTYRLGILSIYSDGALAGAWRLDDTPIDFAAADAVSIGGSPLAGFDGVLAMVAIWDRALGEAEVFQHFVAGSNDDVEVEPQLTPGLGVEFYGDFRAAPRGSQGTEDVSFGPEQTDSPDRSTLEVSSDRRFVVHFGGFEPVPEGRQTEGVYASVVSNNDYVDALDFDVAAVWRHWNYQESMWTNWRDGEEWSEEGADGPEDRSEPFGTITPVNRTRQIVAVPPALVDFWREQPDRNGGLIVFRSSDASAGIREFVSSEGNEYRRPYVARLIGGGELPTTPLAAPDGLRRDNPTRETGRFVLRWAPVVDAEYYDVFINEVWTDRTRGLTSTHDRPPATENRYHVVARDSYGRVSPWSETLVTNEGL